MSDTPHALSKDDTLDEGELTKPHWFRSTTTQAVILGLASFCCPGIWGAMANLGAGGLQSAATGNAATSVLFALMVVVGLFGPALLGKLGPRKLLFLGATGYAPYAAGLYCNSKFGTQWGVIFGAACCGLGAGAFWCVEGTLITSYPEPNRRARAIAIWFSLNQLGSVIGGSINLALNADTNRTGGISVNTYSVFIAIQCLGPFAALLLSEPGQVQRRDGKKPVIVSNRDGFIGELKATVKVWKKPSNLLYAIAFFMTQWGPGSTSWYLTTYFTVRSRALSSFVAAILNQSCIWGLGVFLDNQRISMRTRATSIGILLTAGLGYSWIHFFVNQYHFYHLPEKPTFDWSTPGFANAWVPILLNSLFSQLLFNQLYWVVSFLATGEDMGRHISCMRVVESLSSCVTYGVSAADLPVINVAAVNLAIYASALYPIFHMIRHVIRREEAGLNDVPAVEHDDRVEEVEKPPSGGLNTPASEDEYKLAA